MKRKLFVSIIVLAGFVVLLLVGMCEPTCIMRGLVFREPFYRGRSTSYWRKLIQADGQAGAVNAETWELFDDTDAVPMLEDCLSDSDPNVRWPAVYLLYNAGFHDGEPAIRKALNDSSVEVKLAAIRVLGWLRREALLAIPTLIELAHDSNVDISTAAHYALWEIDRDKALNAGAWNDFTSKRWEFTVSMPGLPAEKETLIDTPYGQVRTYSFAVPFCAAHCTVAVAENPPQVQNDISEKERYDSVSQETAVALGGNLVHYEPIGQHGHGGREQIIEVEGKAILHARLFLIGDRSYQINMTYPPETVSPNAIEFFLDSFRIDYSL